MVQAEQSVVTCVCVRVCVLTITYELNDFRPRYLSCLLILTPSKSISKVKVKVQGHWRKLELSNCWDGRPWRSETETKGITGRQGVALQGLSGARPCVQLTRQWIAWLAGTYLVYNGPHTTWPSAKTRHCDGVM